MSLRGSRRHMLLHLQLLFSVPDYHDYIVVNHVLQLQSPQLKTEISFHSFS